MTEILKVNENSIDDNIIIKAANLIKSGEIVAFPTETVYGIGANAFNPNAIKKIFIAKGRPKDNPLIVHIAELNDLKEIAKEIPANALIAIKKFWPGPLTIILKKSDKIPFDVTSGLSTVAIRMPSNKIALKLIKMSKVPIAAPSANLSGKPSSVKAEHVYNDFKDKIPLILDGGETDIGLESTVVDFTSKIPVLLRPGKITFEELKKVLGKVKFASKNSKKPKCPGMKYRHYSPEVPVIISKNIKKDIEKFKKNFSKIGVISISKAKADMTYNAKNIKDLGKKLYNKLREFDKKVDAIIVEAVDKKGLGLAIMNRLEKASNK